MNIVHTVMRGGKPNTGFPRRDAKIKDLLEEYPEAESVLVTEGKTDDQLRFFAHKNPDSVIWSMAKSSKSIVRVGINIANSKHAAHARWIALRRQATAEAIAEVVEGEGRYSINTKNTLHRHGMVFYVRDEIDARRLVYGEGGPA